MSGLVSLSQTLIETLYIGDGILFLPFFTTRDARQLRGVCREFRVLVTNFPWDDRADESRVAARAGAVELWRLCFPSAVACTLWQGQSVDNPHVTDADLVLLRGVRYLNMGGCTHVTNAGVDRVLEGQHLQTFKCQRVTCMTDALFANLVGIQMLDMSGCSEETITDAAFAHLAGIHTLYMDNCNQTTITDAAFAHLAGIDTLDMSRCNQATITDAAFAHLAGIDALYMNGCNQATITDAAFAHLAGTHTLYMNGCNQATITDATFAHLAGICTLIR